MKIAIDLALRKIGICVFSDTNELIDFILFDSNPKKINDEELLKFNKQRIYNYLFYDLYYAHYDTKKDFENHHNHTHIFVLEGLSFNSKSKEIDLIDANHWVTRCLIKENFINSSLNIKHPKSWQKYIVTKDILSEWAKIWPITRAKRGKKLTKEQQTVNNKSKAEIRKLTKELIYNSLPEDIKEKFNKYIKDNKIKTDALYDLSDAYWIGILYDRE